MVHCVYANLFNGQLQYFFSFQGQNAVYLIFIWNNEAIYLEVYFPGVGGRAP